MQINLEKTFELPVGPSPAWTALQDIPSVAECVPGTEITERTDARHYKGRVKVKVGPVAVAFKGDIEVQEILDAERRLHVVGRGGDGKGSSATLDLLAQIAEAGGRSVLKGNATVTVNGQIVRLAGRMLKQVADQILDQFGNNFTALLQSAEEAAPPATAPENRELSALPLLWRSTIAWLRRRFGLGTGT